MLRWGCRHHIRNGTQHRVQRCRLLAMGLQVLLCQLQLVSSAVLHMERRLGVNSERKTTNQGLISFRCDRQHLIEKNTGRSHGASVAFLSCMLRFDDAPRCLTPTLDYLQLWTLCLRATCIARCACTQSLNLSMQQGSRTE